MSPEKIARKDSHAGRTERISREVVTGPRQNENGMKNMRVNSYDEFIHQRSLHVNYMHQKAKPRYHLLVWLDELYPIRTTDTFAAMSR